jgi:predicted ATPase
VGTDGDSFFVAFEDTTAAISACVAAQRALHAEPWPADASIHVRMGVHSGLAQPIHGDYIAYAVHQAARVADAGNGGQVVVSGEAASRASPVDGVRLCSLGRFRVRDFDDPVELFRAEGDGAPGNTAPLRVPPADQHNLIPIATSLVGRVEDLDELAALVATHPLVSIVGPGGIGKTRLAIEYGLAHAADWDDGVWFVDLGRVADGIAILLAIAEAIAAPVGSNDDVRSCILDHLAARRIVVIVDNCEHVLAPAARLLDQLVRAGSDVHVLATSREPLGLRAERIWRPRLLDATTSGASLFCQRAGLDTPDPPTLAAVTDVCEMLDGLPLAIELAAGRADVVTPAEIADRLRAGRGLGASPDPTLDARQRSLEELIGWSYDLLSVDEQHVLRCLGVFVGGFDLESAVVAIADDQLDAPEIPDLVWNLLSKSLVVNDSGAGTTRYRLLATIRSFARRLLDDDELVTVARRVALYYLRSFGPGIDKIDAELVSQRSREVDNLRALVPVLSSDAPSVAQMLACCVVLDVAVRSNHEAIEIGLTSISELPAETPERVALITMVARCAIERGDSSLGDRLITLAIELRTGVGAPGWLDGRIDQQRGLLAMLEGDPSSALGIARDALPTAATVRGRSIILNLMAIAAADAGAFDVSAAATEEGLQIARDMGDLMSQMRSIGNLAEIALRSGRVRDAARYQLDGLEIALSIGSPLDTALAAVAAARIAVDGGHWQQAVRLQAAAERVLETAGHVLYPTDRTLCDDLLEAASGHLGAVAYESARTAGANGGIERMVDRTRDVLEAASSPG